MEYNEKPRNLTFSEFSETVRHVDAVELAVCGVFSVKSLQLRPSRKFITNSDGSMHEAWVRYGKDFEDSAALKQWLYPEIRDAILDAVSVPPGEIPFDWADFSVLIDDVIAHFDENFTSKPTTQIAL